MRDILLVIFGIIIALIFIELLQILIPKFRNDVTEHPYAIAVGDSFTYGTGVQFEQVWTEVLERKINKKIVNIGSEEYTTTQELQSLNSYISLKPKVILWGFFANDYSDEIQLRDTNPLKNTVVYKFARNFLAEKFNVMASSSVSYTNGSVDQVFFPQFWKYLFNNTVKGKGLANSNILTAKKLAESNGIIFIVLIFPPKEEIYKEVIKDDELNYELSYIKDSITTLCKENKISCIDIAPDLIKNNQIYFRIDAHFNEKGNSIVADSVYKYLKENNLIN